MTTPYIIKYINLIVSLKILIILWFFFVVVCFVFCFLGLHPSHIEVPRLVVETKLQLWAYATAALDPSLICDLYHSSQKWRILNPLSEARDWTCNLMVPSWICFCCTTTGTPQNSHNSIKNPLLYCLYEKRSLDAKCIIAVLYFMFALSYVVLIFYSSLSYSNDPNIAIIVSVGFF